MLTTEGQPEIIKKPKRSESGLCSHPRELA